MTRVTYDFSAPGSPGGGCSSGALEQALVERRVAVSGDGMTLKNSVPAATRARDALLVARGAALVLCSVDVDRVLQLWALDEPEEDDAPPAAARQVCMYQLPGVAIGARPGAADGETSDSGSDASASSARSDAAGASASARKKKRKPKKGAKEKKGDTSE